MSEYVSPLVGVIEDSAPPSTYAVAAVLQGERGSTLRAVGLTVARGTVIIPGLWLAGKVFRVPELKLGWKLVGVAMAASTCVTLGMLAWYYLGSKFAVFRPNGDA